MNNNTINTLVSWGTYTPTCTATANLDSVSASACQYLRVGNVVIVSGKINVDATTSGNLTQFRVSLPISSTFGNDHECGGGGAEKTTSTQPACTIFADTSNNEASFIYRAGSATAASLYFSFTYQII